MLCMRLESHKLLIIPSFEGLCFVEFEIIFPFPVNLYLAVGKYQPFYCTPRYNLRIIDTGDTRWDRGREVGWLKEEMRMRICKSPRGRKSDSGKAFSPSKPPSVRRYVLFRQ